MIQNRNAFTAPEKGERKEIAAEGIFLHLDTNAVETWGHARDKPHNL
jgi:hypothetical protein